ncbi:dienelactone hydrolase family protein [Mesorhizobium sp. LHD-90]|uniref:dienelactone hydrolase family protein n=1 Tax=Mesorhizobium sp. LHD-90 TaxID=3071414 RepID=UPI0027E0AF42|nr:dienelactone hydrolase family protein [Mesorhizobium sp. LHD-90]MDQ6433031.1 dienelactone hydrolase family protein [Mesorhizobium sp. LHD-90]
MSKREIEIKTADGTAKAHLFEGGAAGILVYMDAFGLRPALDGMAEQLAGEGYTVLVPDLFYRKAPYGPFEAKTAFNNDQTRAQLTSLIGGTTQEMTQRDTAAFLAALDAAGATGPIGTVGYCMGGGRALNAAATYPDRIAAAASFHGGNLASDAPDSPHRHVANIKGRVYVGVAGVDRSFPPEQSARLAQALREAEVDHIIENYVGMGHGWCVPDHGAYDEIGAERHWERLTTFFAETLSDRV